MSKPTLSISGYQTYVECPHKYKLDKIDKLRPITQPSYFIFGSAVDKGINEMLINLGRAENETPGDPMEACERELRRLLTERVEFMEIDYDGELIDEKKKAELLKQAQKLGYQGDDVDSLATSLLTKPIADLSENQRKVLSLCCMASLHEKARLMMNAYQRKVLPLINSVEGVQQEIRWEDSLGNQFVGVLDVPADLSGYGPVIGDNKTSSRPYEQNSVRMSPQLAIYAKATGKSKGAFFVMEKRILKNRVKTCSVCGNVGLGRHKTCDVMSELGVRCDGEWNETIKPEVNLQIIVDDIPQSEQDITQEAMTGVAESIKKGCFPKNVKGCVQQYGRKTVRCPYYDYCRNGSTAGLETKKTK